MKTNEIALEFYVKINDVKIKFYINNNFSSDQTKLKSVPHNHHDYEVHYLFFGNYTYVIDNVEYDIQDDKILIIKPGEYHYLKRKNDRDFKEFNLRFSIEQPRENELTSIKNNYKYIVNLLNKTRITAINVKLGRIFFLLGEELKHQKYGFTDAVKSYAILTLTEFIRLLDDNDNTAQDAQEILGYSRTKIDEFFCEKYLTNVSIEDLANDMSISSRQANRIIKKMYGVNFSQKLREMRLYECAVRLVNTNESITKICTDCGFQNNTHFFNIFKDKFGVTPSEYRNLGNKSSN